MNKVKAGARYRLEEENVFDIESYIKCLERKQIDLDDQITTYTNQLKSDADLQLTEEELEYIRQNKDIDKILDVLKKHQACLELANLDSGLRMTSMIQTYSLEDSKDFLRIV